MKEISEFRFLFRDTVRRQQFQAKRVGLEPCEQPAELFDSHNAMLTEI